MNIKEIYIKFYSRLVKALPMKDATFIANLTSQKLISENLKHKVGPGLNITPGEAASCFLDEVIGPAIYTGYNKPFSLLLSEMESFSDLLKNLAEEINKEIQMLKTSVIGKHVAIYIAMYTYISTPHNIHMCHRACEYQPCEHKLHRVIFSLISSSLNMIFHFHKIQKKSH